MILDRMNTFSIAQAITSSANSTDVMDLTARRRISQPGGNHQVTLRLQETFLAAGAATLTVALVTADDSALSVNARVLAQTAAIPKAALLIGSEIAKWGIPSNHLRRYLGVVYTVANGPFTAGKITAAAIMGRDDNYNYQAGRVRFDGGAAAVGASPGPVGLPAAPAGYEYRRVVSGAQPVVLGSQRVFALIPIAA